MILAALALLAAAPCGQLDTNLPHELAGWARGGRTLDTRHAMVLRGRRGSAVQTNVTIRKAGVFGVAVDQQAWVDIYRGRGRPLTMASESRGPACSSIRKIVRYRLQPGSYRVTVTRLPSDRVKLMLVHGQPRARSRRRSSR